jgi:hypothetical protein
MKSKYACIRKGEIMDGMYKGLFLTVVRPTTVQMTNWHFEVIKEVKA